MSHKVLIELLNINTVMFKMECNRINHQFKMQCNRINHEVCELIGFVIFLLQFYENRCKYHQGVFDCSMSGEYIHYF